MIFPTFDEEQQLWNQGFEHIAGIDEVGRGAFAGPVVAAAVILPPTFATNLGVADSKLLTPKKRETLAEIIKERATAWSIAEVSVPYINTFGIGKAAQLAFAKTVKQLHVKPHYYLIDAFFIARIGKRRQKPIIKGDQKSMSIAAASIIAKVYRDNLMRTLSHEFAHYKFSINKGYGTASHRAAIKQYGLCKLHRRSFDLSKFM